MGEARAAEAVAASRPDGVVVFTDPPMALAATVGEILDLRFHDRPTARRLTDKFAQRAALARAGIDALAVGVVRGGGNGRGAHVLADGFPFPAVLKPRQGTGSRDTFRVDGPDQLPGLLATLDDEEFVVEEHLGDRPHPDRSLPRGAAGVAHDEPGRPATGLLESADMVSVESVAEDGRIRHFAVTGRFPLAPPFRETGSYLPSDITADESAAVTRLAGRAASALGVRQGILHTEIKLTPTGPRVIEVNGRLGGGISPLVERLGGPSLVTVAMQVALGLETPPARPPADRPVTFFAWILAPGDATTVAGVDGLAELRELPGVETVRLNRRTGDRVDPREGGAGHVVAVEGTVASHTDLAVLRRRIASRLTLRYT